LKLRKHFKNQQGTLTSSWYMKYNLTFGLETMNYLEITYRIPVIKTAGNDTKHLPPLFTSATPHNETDYRHEIDCSVH
jgi:hypothetical protein